MLWPEIPEGPEHGLTVGTLITIELNLRLKGRLPGAIDFEKLTKNCPAPVADIPTEKGAELLRAYKRVGISFLEKREGTNAELDEFAANPENAPMVPFLNLIKIGLENGGVILADGLGIQIQPKDLSAPDISI